MKNILSQNKPAFLAYEGRGCMVGCGGAARTGAPLGRRRSRVSGDPCTKPGQRSPGRANYLSLQPNWRKSSRRTQVFQPDGLVPTIGPRIRRGGGGAGPAVRPEQETRRPRSNPQEKTGGSGQEERNTRSSRPRRPAWSETPMPCDEDEWKLVHRQVAPIRQADRTGPETAPRSDPPVKFVCTAP